MVFYFNKIDVLSIIFVFNKINTSPQHKIPFFRQLTIIEVKMSLTNDNSMQMAQTVNSQPTTTYIPKYNAQGVLIEEDMIVSNNGQPITIYAYKYSDQGVFTEQDITN